MKEQLIILDGGMGTDLQHSGLKPGENPAVYGMTHAAEIRDIHMKYIKKGTNCIYTNTFGASGNKLKGSGYSVDEVVQRNVETAVEAVLLMKEQGRECMVALDVGPLGELLEPLGTLPFEEAYRRPTGPMRKSWRPVRKPARTWWYLKPLRICMK